MACTSATPNLHSKLTLQRRFGYHKGNVPHYVILMTKRTMKNISRNLFASWLLLAGSIMAISASSAAQEQTVSPALRPPKGAQVAIVVFEDLQCPECRRAAPMVEEASKTYKIPLMRHDFPLPMHNWSYDAAVMARYFDTPLQGAGQRFPRLHFLQPVGNQSAEPARLRREVRRRAQSRFALRGRSRRQARGSGQC